MERQTRKRTRNLENKKTDTVIEENEEKNFVKEELEDIESKMTKLQDSSNGKKKSRRKAKKPRKSIKIPSDVKIKVEAAVETETLTKPDGTSCLEDNSVNNPLKEEVSEEELSQEQCDTKSETEKSKKSEKANNAEISFVLNEDEKYACDLCDKTYEKLAMIKRHRYLHTYRQKPKEHHCTYIGCDKSFIDRANLRKHIKGVHLNIRNYLCEFCVDRFKSLSSLKKHIDSYHTKREKRICYTCHLCNRTFFHPVSIKHHRCLETEDGNFVCTHEGCGKSFRLQEYLTKHMKVHLGVKPYQCDICEQKFTRKTYLETHMYKHTGVKSFHCDDCGKFFSQKGNLKTHMLTHTKQRPLHECSECGQTFTFKSNLKKHQERHTIMKTVDQAILKQVKSVSDQMVKPDNSVYTVQRSGNSEYTLQKSGNSEYNMDKTESTVYIVQMSDSSVYNDLQLDHSLPC